MQAALIAPTQGFTALDQQIAMKLQAALESLAVDKIISWRQTGVDCP